VSKSNRTRLEGRILRRERGRKKISGTPERPRLCVFFSNRQVYSQIIDDARGHTIASAGTLDEDLKEQTRGKNPTEAAKLVGATIAKRAKEKGLEKIVFDKSGYRYGKRLSALADAARKEGLVF